MVIIEPAKGMDAANEHRSPIAAIPVGNAVVVRASPTGGRALGDRRLPKTQLRSQQIALALGPLPPFTQPLHALSISPLKQIAIGHDNDPPKMVSLTVPLFLGRSEIAIAKRWGSCR